MAPGHDPEVDPDGGGDYHHAPHPPHPPDHHAQQRETDADQHVGIILIRGVTILTIIAALMCAFMNGNSLVRSFRWRIDIFVGILRIYAIILALFVAVAETEWGWLFYQWPMLEYWFFRGNVIIFVAVITKALSGLSWEIRIESILHDVAAWILAGCGFIYFFAGVICMGPLQRKRQRTKQWRDRAVQEIKDIDKKKGELEHELHHGP